MQLHDDVLLDNKAIETINQMYNNGRSLRSKRAFEENDKRKEKSNKKVENPSNSSDVGTPVMTDSPSTLFETTTMQVEEDTTVLPRPPPTKTTTPKPKVRLFKAPEDIPR